MRHEDALGRLPALIGLRAAAADQEMNAHLAECARCRERLRELRAVDSGLRTLDVPQPPSLSLARRVLAIPTGGGAPERRHHDGRRVAVAVAVVAPVTLLAAAAVGVHATRDDPGRSPDFLAERVVRLVTPRPEAVSAEPQSGADRRFEAQIEIEAAEGRRLPMRIIATGLPRGGDRYYGPWLTGPGGAVSAESFWPDGEGRCVVMLQVPSGDWTVADITDRNRPPSLRITVARAPL